MRNTYPVCYEITEDKRRDRVFCVCKNHGEHLGFSVFACDLNGSELAALQRELDASGRVRGRLRVPARALLLNHFLRKWRSAKYPRWHLWANFPHTTHSASALSAAGTVRVMGEFSG
jgi:CRISPR associated protein Cas2